MSQGSGNSTKPACYCSIEAPLRTRKSLCHIVNEQVPTLQPLCRAEIPKASAEAPDDRQLKEGAPSQAAVTIPEV
jgi:hypothetical protein